MSNQTTSYRPDIEIAADCLNLAIDKEAELVALRQRLAEVEGERDQALRELSEQSRLRGIAEGTLEATWLPGVVRGWQQRADAAEAKLGQVRELIAKENHRSQWNTAAGWDAANFLCQRLTAILETEPPSNCGCIRCLDARPPMSPCQFGPNSRQRMVVCPVCGNKRCPRANWHGNECTGSNEPGQPGSAFESIHKETSP